MYFFLVLGSGIQLINYENECILLIGQFSIGLGLSFGLNSITQFCAYWFEKSVCNTFYGLLTLSPLLGAAVGPIIPFLLIPFSKDRSLEESKNLIINYLIYMTIFIVFFFILGMVFLKCFDNIQFREDEIPNRLSSQFIEDDETSESENIFDLDAKRKVLLVIKRLI